MRYIANILTDNPSSLEVNELYNVVEDKSLLIDGLPTLIVGWDRTKEMYPKASIIEWVVSDNVYWTYGKYERRDKYEENLIKFRNVAVKKYIESVTYTFYDVLLEGPQKFDSFIEFLKSPTKKTVYINNNMMYVCYQSTPKVIGLSLRDCEYLDPGLKKRIFSTIYNNPSVEVLKNNEEISKDIRYKLKNRSYLLPYIFS